MKRINENIYYYKTTDDELELINNQFLYFLKYDLKIDIDKTKIKIAEPNKTLNFESPATFMYYYIFDKKNLSSNPHIKHYKNNECNIFEFYRNSENLIKIKDVIDLLR